MSPFEDVSGGTPSLGRRKWWLLFPAFLLNLFSAFSFNKFMGAAAYYSARIPITSVTPPDEAAQILHARQLADRFFLIFVALIFLGTLLMGPIIQLREVRRFRFRVRDVLLLALCIVALGVMAHVFFVYSVVVAALAALLMTPAVQDRMGPNVFRLVIRYLLALALSVLSTGVLVWIMAVTRLS